MRYEVKPYITYEDVDRLGMHHYVASVSLPRKVQLEDLDDVAAQLMDALRRHRPDMQPYGSFTLEADVSYGGNRLTLSLEGISPWAPCSHLADAGQPIEGLSPEPCKLCGRYFVDD